MTEPAVDIIMRTGGRPTAVVERAVSSLVRQSAGAIRLILVRHGPADDVALRRLIGGALREIVVVDAPGANRGRAMAAGLARVEAPLFGVLDDDDYLLETHLQRLLAAAESVPSPAFAYGDILAEDEGAPQTGLRLFREGPAQPPLGRITDRISVHSFLADRRAMEGLPFERWELATAEDALLVAALLSRSTPAHSPHATCVYVQGRGDASSYLSHPDRAADELTFARELAPIRATIEAKFGAAQDIAEAEWLAPFEAAARNAALFKRLRSGTRDGGRTVGICNGAEALTVDEDPALAVTPALLAFEPVAGAVRAAGGVVEIDAEQDYAFASRARLDLPATARPALVAVRVSKVEGVFGLALSGADGALIAESRVEATPGPVEVQLPWDRAETPTLIVRRLSALGSSRPHLQAEAILLAFRADALAPGGGREAQVVLDALAGAPRTLLSPALKAPLCGEGETALDGSHDIALGEAPWAYAFSAPLPEENRGAGLRVDLGPTWAGCFVLRVDNAWEVVRERVEVSPGRRPSHIWLEPLLEGAAASRLVIQAGAAPAGAQVTLRGVFLYPRA